MLQITYSVNIDRQAGLMYTDIAKFYQRCVGGRVGVHTGIVGSTNLCTRIEVSVLRAGRGGGGWGGWKFLVTEHFFPQKHLPGVLKRQKKGFFPY